MDTCQCLLSESKMENILAAEKGRTQTELLPRDNITFLAVRWSAEDGTVKGRTQTELLPRDYTMTGDKGTLQLTLTTTYDEGHYYILYKRQLYL